MERRAATAWIKRKLALRGSPQAPLRRLSRVEYEHTVQDLLAVDVDLQAILPDDGRSLGFDKLPAALSFSPVLMARYLEAADAALGRANITVNKNSVPNDPQSPFVTSGLRLGTPAITTRGFGEDETRQLTRWIADILDDIDSEETIERVKNQVLALCKRFPVYV